MSGEKRRDVLKRSDKWGLLGEVGVGQMVKGSQGSRPRSDVSGDETLN